jgi:hypothetical protein
MDSLLLLLTELLSIDNNTRKSAETRLSQEWVEKQPHVLLVALAQFMATNPSDQVTTTY